MKAVTVKELKLELSNRTYQEVTDLCLRLSKFKKENKELLTYVLFESSYEEGYIEGIKTDIEEQFKGINTDTNYYIKKSVRKILRTLKRFIRYSKKKDTEVILLLYFCKTLKDFEPHFSNSNVLNNILNREVLSIRKKIAILHEDLQYDYTLEMQQNGLI